MHLDPFDAKILDLVQENARLTHADIGSRVNLSASSVRRRLDAMRRDGVIRAEVALIDPAIAGPSILVIVAVTFEREGPGSYDLFRREMIKHPEVLQCYSVAGQFDFILVVCARDPAAYEEWSYRVITPLPDVRRYDSFVVWSTVKSVTKRPLGSFGI